MKPLNLIALLLFLGGAVWALTRSERAVREIQRGYFSAMSPFLTSGSKLETEARSIMAAFADRPHVFNLGHGIDKDTPIAHVERLLAVVRGKNLA